MIQLGTRWRFGEQPPARVGAEFAAAVGEAEAALVSEVDGDPGDGNWTVTWLEGRPTAIFDLETRDGGTVSVTVDATGTPEVAIHRPLDDGDDSGW